MCINYKIFNIMILKNEYLLLKIQNCLNIIEIIIFLTKLI